MTLTGDHLIWLCLIIACLAAAACLAIAVHRSFTRRSDSEDRSEFDAFWRNRR